MAMDPRDPRLIEALSNYLMELDMRQRAGLPDPADVFQGPNALQGGVVNPLQSGPQPGGRGFSRGGQPYPEWQGPDISGFLQGAGNVASAINPFDAQPASAAGPGLNPMFGPGGQMDHRQLGPEVYDDYLQSDRTQTPLDYKETFERNAAQGRKKKKGEFSEFFKILKAAKSEDKKGSTRKALSELAKQLDAPSETSEEAKATGSLTI